MNRRQAVAAIGSGGLVFAGSAAADDAASLLKLNVVIPELYDMNGARSRAPTLRNAGYGLQFFVVIENVSINDTFIWSEHNSTGHGTLSFEVELADGETTIVKRIEWNSPANILQAVRLAPGAMDVRVIKYDSAPGQSSDWKFPFGPKYSRREVMLRAVFEQSEQEQPDKLQIWSGRIASAAYKIVLENR